MSFDENNVVGTHLHEDSIVVSPTELHFGLLQRGRKYTAQLITTLSPLQVEIPHELLTARDEDVASLPPIRAEGLSQVLVEWRCKGVLDVTVSAVTHGDFEERVDVGGEILVVKARIVEGGLGTPSLRHGVHRLKHGTSDGESKKSLLSVGNELLKEE